MTVELLNAYGVTMEEVADWKSVVKGNRIALSGAFTEEGLMRVNSLTHLPSPALHAHAHASAAQQATPGGTAPATPNPTQPKTPLEATQAHFKATEMLRQSLKRKKHEMKTIGQLAQWINSYAVKIDRLPTLQVDKEMLQFGHYGRRVETNAAYGVANHFGVYGAAKSSIRQANQAATAVRFQTRAQAGGNIIQITENIELADAQIRESMTHKYQVQF